MRYCIDQASITRNLLDVSNVTEHSRSSFLTILTVNSIKFTAHIKKETAAD